MTWGPFQPGRDPAELRAELRCLRTCIRLLTGPRGREAAYRVLVAEISGDDPEALAEAEREFDRLPPLDARRVLASFSAVNFEKPKPCKAPALTGEKR